ncbi:MAG: phosphoribosylglycinamide formyltransferase, partial [Planctomycetaceae bacterium]|nr:phosphoribosylglycinamide formyltransferase [Planctomycetaceae bacterium]
MSSFNNHTGNGLSRSRLAIFVSGGGTTFVNLADSIAQSRLSAGIDLVLANRECLGIDRAQQREIPSQVVIREHGESVESYSERLFQICRDREIDLVVLGGFLSRLSLPEDFHQRVVNIHPSLIPAFCGQGMYGHHVHEAVLDRGCQVSGCTVHFCDNEYDHGPIIGQSVVPVLDGDTPESLAARVFEAECELYPRAIQA